MRARLLEITDHITKIDVDYEWINSKEERDTVAGTLTIYGVPVMYWDKRDHRVIAKEALRNEGYVVKQ